MTTMVVDPRTEQVNNNADEINHWYCEICYPNDYASRFPVPSLCGKLLPPEDNIPEEGDSNCPMCNYIWENNIYPCEVNHV